MRTAFFAFVVGLVAVGFVGCDSPQQPNNLVVFDESKPVMGDSVLPVSTPSPIPVQKSLEPEVEEESDPLLVEIRSKYQATELLDWEVAEYGRDGSQPLVFDCGKGLTGLDVNNVFDAFLDVDLTDELFLVITYDSELGKLEVVPSRENVFKYPDESKDLGVWGNISKLWLVNRLSLDDGSVLEREVVRYVEFSRELPHAYVEFFVDDFGYASLEWSSISGAETYEVYEFVVGNGSELCETVLYNIGSTEMTWFNNFNDRKVDSQDGSVVSQNFMFADFSRNERRGFCVVGVSESGRSCVSNFVFPSEFLGLIPNRIESGSSLSLRNVSSLPSVVGVMMCDGTVSERVVDYANANSVLDDRYGGEKYVVVAPVLGTELKAEFEVDSSLEFNEELVKVVDRQNLISNVGGRVLFDVDIVGNGAFPSWFSQFYLTEGSSLVDVPLNAEGSLSHFIGLNMLVGNNVVDLLEFPEAGCPEVLREAIDFAVVQNPLIGGVDRVGYAGSSGELYVDYCYDKAGQATMQSNVMNEVRSKISSVIRDDMTSLEKEEAVVKCLIDVSDFDSLVFGEMKDSGFKFVSERGVDSANAIGVLMNGSGVSCGYANAFKIFADSLGLKSVVVSGFVNGVPSAWNKIDLGLGDVDAVGLGSGSDWFSLDVSAGDDLTHPLSVFNVPDSELDGIYFEDSRYSGLVGDGVENELYELSGAFVDYQDLEMFLINKCQIGEDFLFRTKRSVGYGYVAGILESVSETSFVIYESVGIYFVDLEG
jgi:hypothetical protein